VPVELVDSHEPVDDAGALTQAAAELAAAGGAGGGDVFEADRLAGQLGADGAAHERVVVEHPQLGEVARVVADRDRLADEGGHPDRDLGERASRLGV
jgi:hypothetical protein